MLEASADLERKIDDLGRLELPALLHLVREGGSLDALHDDERPAVVLADVEDLDDVGMGELGGEPRLSEEAVAKAGRVRKVLGENLDRDGPLELSIACEVDGGHAAAPEDILDLIPPVGDGFGGVLQPVGERCRSANVPRVEGIGDLVALRGQVVCDRARQSGLLGGSVGAVTAARECDGEAHGRKRPGARSHGETVPERDKPLTWRAWAGLWQSVARGATRSGPVFRARVEEALRVVLLRAPPLSARPGTGGALRGPSFSGKRFLEGGRR